jgi:predicted metal-dependent HD superfamily phosphohydrolase
VATVDAWIMTTMTHIIDPTDTDLQFFSDFDLAILAETPLVYQEYVRHIREEVGVNQ